MWWKRTEFLWALRVFAKSIGLTLVLWLFLLALSTLLFYSPQPLASTTMDMVYLALGRVILLEEKVGLWIAIFILNTVVMIVASISSALLSLTLVLESKDLKYRMVYPAYEKIAKAIDKVVYILLWSPLFLIFNRVDSRFMQISQSENAMYSNQGFWKFCGYSGKDFRRFFYIFPYIIPALTAIVNGIFIGMVLAINVFMGAYDGFLIAGFSGLIIGVSFNITYFLSFTIPHGFIELFALLLTIALGYNFALIYSNEIFEHKLLIKHSLGELEEDVKDLVIITKRFLKSKMVVTTLTFVLCLVFIAAYIEVYITPNIAEKILGYLNG